MSNMRDPYGRNAVSHRSTTPSAHNARSGGAYAGRTGNYGSRPAQRSAPSGRTGMQRSTGARQPQPVRRPPQRNPQPRRNCYNGRRPAARRRNSLVYAITAAAVLLLAIIIAIVCIRPDGNLETDIFANNVFINGTALAGYTREDGYAMMEQIRDQRINASYTITYGEKKWVFHPADVEAWIDFESALAQAWNFGHVGDKSTRKKILASLETNPVYLNCELTYNEEALNKFVENIAAEVYVAPVEAEVTLTAEKPVFNRSVSLKESFKK